MGSEYRRVGRFAAEPELQRQLQALEDNIIREMRRLERTKADAPKVRFVRAEYDAQDRELVVANSAAAALTVWLPPPAQGSVVWAVRSAGSNTVTIDCKTATVDGSTSSVTDKVTAYYSDGDVWYREL